MTHAEQDSAERNMCQRFVAHNQDEALYGNIYCPISITDTESHADGGIMQKLHNKTLTIFANACILSLHVPWTLDIALIASSLSVFLQSAKKTLFPKEQTLVHGESRVAPT